MRIYVAGSRKELERIEAAYRAVRDAGHELAMDWAAEVRAGPGSDSLLMPEQRRSAAERCNVAVCAADLLWLLVPKVTSGRGCWVELGIAISEGIPIVVSGDLGVSIFTSLADASFVDQPFIRCADDAAARFLVGLTPESEEIQPGYVFERWEGGR